MARDQRILRAVVYLTYDAADIEDEQGARDAEQDIARVLRVGLTYPADLVEVVDGQYMTPDEADEAGAA